MAVRHSKSDIEFVFNVHVQKAPASLDQHAPCCGLRLRRRGNTDHSVQGCCLVPLIGSVLHRQHGSHCSRLLPSFQNSTSFPLIGVVLQAVLDPLLQGHQVGSGGAQRLPQVAGRIHILPGGPPGAPAPHQRPQRDPALPGAAFRPLRASGRMQPRQALTTHTNKACRGSNEL